MENKLRGIFVPAVTPFDDEGGVDLRRMEKIFEKWRKTGLSGMMVLGTNGESRHLSDRSLYRSRKPPSSTRATKL